MQFCKVALLLVAASIGHAAAGDHPVAKVVSLLQDLMEKVKTEGQTEEVSYAKFTYWCKTSVAALDSAIADENDSIDTLSSTIEGKTKEIEVLKADILSLADDIKELGTSDTEAGKENKARNDLYLAKETNLKATIKAMGEAITALKDAAKTTTDSKLLLSQHKAAQDHVRNIFALIATVASEDEQSSLLNFVQDDAVPKGVLAAGDDMKHVKKYNFKSSSVTELLKTLQLKFEDDLTAVTVAETNAANAYELSKKARDATSKAAEDSKKQKETDQGDAEAALSTAQGDLKNSKDDLKADSAAHDDTTSECATKATEWSERSNIRSQELEAMAMAVKILAKVAGVRTGAPGNPVPPPSPVTLMQVQLEGASDPQGRAVQLLRATAKMYSSKALERLAMEVSAHAPKMFQDVINQIQKMVFRLKQEQIDEDNHKAWCDLEIEKTTKSISTKKDKIDELSAKLKEDNAKVASLTTEIAAAAKMVSEITAFQKEATEIRTTGKGENKLAIDDAKAAQRAITNAISVLQTFYKSSGQIAKEPWEFVQTQAVAPGTTLPKNPATWDSPKYTGVDDPSKAGTGIIAVLEAVSSDFMKMEANTRAQEVADGADFDKTMKQNSIEKARRGKESEMKSAEKKRLIDRITSTTANKKHVTDEKESTDQYMKDLAPACMDTDATEKKGEASAYDKRKAARTAEITALGKAQGILNTYQAPKSFLQRK